MAEQSSQKSGFTVVPKGASGCVVVFHEVWGLVKHTQDVCKRIGKLGFAAVAPNLYGGYEGVLVPDKIQKAMESVWGLSLEERRNKERVAQEMERKKVSEDVREVVSIIYDQAFRDKLMDRAVGAVEDAHTEYGKVTTLGFCIGGGLSMKSATRTSKLTSAIGFYGEPPAGDAVDKISVPVLAIFASQDEIINTKAGPFVDAMLSRGKDLTLKTFPNTKHGFFNDTRDEVYDENATIDSWELTKWFLERTLGRS